MEGDAAPAIAILIAKSCGFSRLAPPPDNRRALVTIRAIIAGPRIGRGSPDRSMLRTGFQTIRTIQTLFSPPSLKSPTAPDTGDFRRFALFRLPFPARGSEIDPPRR
jgi:hypothetical protein